MSTAWSSVPRHAWCRKHTSARWRRGAAISRTRSADACRGRRASTCTRMSLTCTVLVEDSNGRVESETRQYRTYGAELARTGRFIAR